MPDRVIPFTVEDAFDIEADAYFTAMEALERAEKEAKGQGINRADIARRTSTDPATITRILNGSTKNISLKTLFKIMAAMNRKVFIHSVDKENLHHLKPNFSFDAPEMNDYQVSTQVFGSVASPRQFNNAPYARVSFAAASE